MNHASLFSGIGGAEVAASMMGWQNLFHCEIQEFPRKVLDYWFPNAESYEDITKTDFGKWRGKVDVLTGGFPCQPFSLAGRRKGADDNRYLWPQMLRAIREILPTWVVGENVAGIKTMVESCQVTKMGRTDHIFEENCIYREESRFTLDKICTDLEAEGYSVQPIVIPACAVGAPHRRDRVWIVAHAKRNGHPSQGHGDKRERTEESQEGKTDHSLGLEDMAVAELLPIPTLQLTAKRGLLPTPTATEINHFKRVEELKAAGATEFQSRKNGSMRPNGLTDYLNFHGMMPTPSARDWKGCTNPCEESKRKCVWRDTTRCGEENLIPSCHPDGDGRQAKHHDDGIIEEAQQGESQLGGADSPQGRWRNFPTQSPVCRGNDGIPFDVDSLTISFPKWRQESIKAYGNAWVPEVAYEIFRAIEAEEHK